MGDVRDIKSNVIKFGPPATPTVEDIHSTAKEAGTEATEGSAWDEVLRKNEKNRKKVEYERKKANEQVARNYRLPPKPGDGA